MLNSIGLIRSAVFLLIAVPIAPVAGCGNPPSSPDTYFNEAEAVFAGKATFVVDFWELNLSYVRLDPRTWSSLFQPVSYTSFDVQNSWKGVSTTSVIVKTHPCIASFQAGSSYLVYADREGDTYSVNNDYYYSGTKPYANAASDLAYLSALPTLSLSPPASISTLVTSVSAVLFLVIAITGIRIAHRRLKLLPFTANS